MKAAIEALKLCEHGNYHCMICEVKLLKHVIADQQELLNIAVWALKEIKAGEGEIMTMNDVFEMVNNALSHLKGANTCAQLSI
jgi:hypothetical protein